MASTGTATPRFVVEEFGHHDFSIHDTRSKLNYGAFFTRKVAQETADRRNGQQARVAARTGEK